MLAANYDVAFAETQRFWSFGDSFTDISNDQPWHPDNPSQFKSEAEHGKHYYPVSYQLFNALGLSTGSSIFLSFGQSGSTVLETPWRGWLNNQVGAALKNLGEAKLGSNDVVMINMGINDADVATGKSKTVTQGAKFAKEAAENAAKQMQRLVDKGARNFIFMAFNSVGFVPEWQAWNSPEKFARADKFAKTYFDTLRQTLAPLTQDGARILLIDLDKVYGSVRNNLRGDDTVKFDCFGPIGKDESCRGRTSIAVLVDALHPTTSGFKILAKQVARAYQDPGTVPDFATLIIDSGGLHGSIINDGTIVLYTGKDSRFAATISGPGALTFAGPGRLLLEGRVELTPLTPVEKDPRLSELLHLQ
ncbi:SGNH/GDSL hydrolase family protein [Phyllobacterium endophyticum]|uniref:SGNH/GDSL hydrolase family protein n=1 Tax=Phyllobacterium endophyticum TaxID=1149773 RepID=UPI00164F1963|nr:SGNH/GDSL hydrolase family protein [Phyllobacterium endophyticum]